MMICPMMVAAVLAATTAAPAAKVDYGKSLPNLAGVPAKDRLRLPVEKTWPAKPGEVALCLWKDDKDAAITLGVDDNNNMNMDWWLRECGSRNLRMTWFLVAGGIDVKGGRLRQNGTWARWQQAIDAGHAVESHSMTHLSKSKDPDWKGLDWEYGESIRLINEHLTNNTVTCIAYPGGHGPKSNDSSIAAKYVIAARGTTGHINREQGINYLDVCAPSSPNLGDNPKASWCDLTRLVTGKSRGWGIMFWHYVHEGNEAAEAKIRRALDFCVEHKDKLWQGTFAEVAKYGQERETATVRSVSSVADKIVFDLTDWMDDKRFDFPLTVKVRLPDGWKTAKATQGGKPLAVKVIDHGGAPYALVDAIPDRGNVEVTSIGPLWRLVD